MTDSLFGKYCYIDTPGIAGKKTVYRILASDTESNTYCEVPYLFNQKPIPHGNNFERIVYVVLDTLVGDDSEILRFALKDVEVIGDIEEDKKHGEWKENENGTYSCSLCQSWIPKEQYYYARYCLHCGADMRGEENLTDEINELIGEGFVI